MTTSEAVLKWLRANVLVMIFAGMLLLQFLTWREIAKLRYEYAPSCGDNYACTVALSKADRSYLDDILSALKNR
jgi:hypothetical protein